MSLIQIQENIKNLQGVETSISLAEKAANQLRKDISAMIGETYPLSSFVNRHFTKWRTKHGDFKDSFKQDVFEEADVDRLSYFKPFNIFSGNELNQMFDFNSFEPETLFVLYVEYDNDGYDDIDWEESKPFKDRQIYDHLIFTLPY